MISFYSRCERDTFSLFPLCIAIVLILCAQTGSTQVIKDYRDFESGSLIPDERYCDQPYIVITKDGNWLCTLTTGAGGEGAQGQHIVSCISKDKGKSWSRPVSIEPSDGPEASWAVPLVLPGGRVYVFYNYNGDNARVVEGVTLKRPDLGGWYAYKYSDDNGLTWSQRYRLPMPLAAVDLGDNPLKGKFQLFWGIDKPNLYDGKVYFAFTRLHKPVNAYGQGWVYVSSDILTEKDPAKIKWDLYPENGNGIVRKDFGSLQEEHNIVPLSNGDLLCFYRTRSGFACQSYSRDGGKTWSLPEKATYTPGGRIFKTPMACPQLFRLSNGKYLFWFHNTSSQIKGSNAPVACRNLGWISAGSEKDGMIYWSQPELVNYNSQRRRGCSYPDIVEDNGEYYLSSTHKDDARVQHLDRELINNLFIQDRLKAVIKRGVILTAREAQLKKGALSMPALPDLSEGKGFTLDLRLTLRKFIPGEILLDSRDETGKGILLETGNAGNLKLSLSDGVTSTSWDSDPGLIKAGQSHHVTFIVDGGPKMISVVVDGLLCDGGDDPERPYGYGRFFAEEDKAHKITGKDLSDVTGGKTLKVTSGSTSQIHILRIYNRYLTISEAISNYRASLE